MKIGKWRRSYQIAARGRESKTTGSARLAPAVFVCGL